MRVSGPAELVAADNGDITGNAIATDPTTTLYQGNLLVILRATSKPGKVRVELVDKAGRVMGKCTLATE